MKPGQGERLHPMYLVMRPGVELDVDGNAPPFATVRVVELYLAFFRAWLRRELQRGSHALSREAELEAVVDAKEEACLDLCRRLAFGMFLRGVTSWTTHDSAVPVKLNPWQKFGQKPTLQVKHTRCRSHAEALAAAGRH